MNDYLLKASEILNSKINTDIASFTMKKAFFLFFLTLLSSLCLAQSTDLARHDFFYAGESKTMRMFIVKNGQVEWSYVNTEWRGEISDAILMTDGNILMAHQFGVAEIDQNQQTVWHYEAPEGTEIHTIQPIGKDYVVFVQNGHPALVRVMRIPECEIVHEFEIPASNGVHGQFRNARLSTRGTLLVCHMGMGYIAEYSVQGRELCRWEVPGAWSVMETGKEHLLVVGRKGLVKEITRDGDTVWELNNPSLDFTSIQKAVKLKNGNLIINNWWNEWGKTPIDTLNSPLQAVEVEPSGNVVWSLNAWKDPDLGPSTTIQPLDQAVDRNRLFFGDYNGRRPRLFCEPNKPWARARACIPAEWRGCMLRAWPPGTEPPASGWRTDGMTSRRPIAW